MLSATTETLTTPVNPQSELLYLLGGMNAKLDNVITEQAAQRIEAAEFRTEVRTEVQDLRKSVGDLGGRMDVVESKQPIKVGWWLVASGIAGIAGIVIATITLLKLLNP